jgi:hypothetical protein
MDYAYADDREGGPDEISVISVHVMQMNNSALKRMGCMIKSTMGHGAVYRLVQLVGS